MKGRASQHYLSALESIDLASDNRLPISLPFPLSKSQIIRDHAFLTVLRQAPTQAYLRKINVNVTGLLGVPLPKLPPNEEVVTTFFSRPLAQEIHIFMVETIKDMSRTVNRITRCMDELRSETRKPHEIEAIKIPLRDLIDRASLAGHILWLFVYSSAAPAHLQMLEVLLGNEISRLKMEHDRKMEMKRADEQAAKSLKQQQARKTEEKNPSPVRGGGVDQASDKAKPKVGIKASFLRSRSGVPMETKSSNFVVDDIDEELDGSFHEYDEADNIVVGGFVNTEDEITRSLVVRRFLQWMRRQVGHIESLKTLCHMCRKMSQFGNLPRISIKVLVVAFQGQQMTPWRDVIHETCKKLHGAAALDSHKVIETIVQRGVIKDSKKELVFHGTLHCEACLASLLQSHDLDQHLHVVSRQPISI